MRIGEIATTAGLPAQTIRFYERRGLLPRPQRDSNGYRTYDESVLSRLGFIRSSQSAGLTLVEIATVLELRGEGATPCAHVGELLNNKLRDVRRQQSELAALETELEVLIARGNELDPATCTDADICQIIAPV
jgi:DNA-binding transcriptional MerR regulator